MKMDDSSGRAKRREILMSALYPFLAKSTPPGSPAGFAGRPNGKHLLMDIESFVELLNEDLETEFQSIVQYTNHVATITGPEYLSIIDELKVHLGQELSHAQVLAEQVAFLGGTPSTSLKNVDASSDSRAALQADLALESDQLERYRQRVTQANDLGKPDVAEALRPLLEQTQEHVRDLRTALGK